MEKKEDKKGRCQISDKATAEEVQTGRGRTIGRASSHEGFIYFDDTTGKVIKARMTSDNQNRGKGAPNAWRGKRVLRSLFPKFLCLPSTE